MAGKGRPDKYKTHIEPYLSKISEMALTMTEQQIAETLGIGYTTFKKYKKLYPTLSEHLKKGRKKLVFELKSALIKKAKGDEYTEKKTVKKRDDISGKLYIAEQSETIKHFAPDVAALNLLLKNYDKDNWSNDPQMLEIRKKELELRKEQINNNAW